MFQKGLYFQNFYHDLTVNNHHTHPPTNLIVSIFVYMLYCSNNSNHKVMKIITISTVVFLNRLWVFILIDDNNFMVFTDKI